MFLFPPPTAGPAQCHQPARPAQHPAGQTLPPVLGPCIYYVKVNPSPHGVRPNGVFLSTAGGGGAAGQFHRGAASGSVRALLLLQHAAVAAVLAAELPDRTGEAAEPREAAAGVGVTSEATGSSR